MPTMVISNSLGFVRGPASRARIACLMVCILGPGRNDLQNDNNTSNL